MIFWICFWILFLPISLFVPTKIVNKKKFPKLKKQNAIICCNHTSNFDAVLLDIKFIKKFRYLGKIELFKNKFKGWFMKKLGCIPVDRSKADLGAIKKTLAVLKDGKPLGIFPQGTRAEEGEIDVETVKNGVTMFSLRTNTPVLPMAIARKPKWFRKNYLVVGDLIFPDQEKTKDKSYAEEFTKKVVDEMNKLRLQGLEILNKKKTKKLQKLEEKKG